ncbi:hypothetical protein BDY17DRAFT_42351 [Neohortaea acidophila]|uniref:DUF7730 domain-containing protein n=1 Tax=Neohortaea acidophila TaxID=245834 RepID=A0A6A6PHV3_9PEZI|nr:uncharacterized protein BDY17DRAFT_42351 [Neohortaea acidophila]KAF2479618.1 hypothetical protein BDY17DRAFT_42351 [Neohortaea acidophila]
MQLILTEGALKGHHVLVIEPVAPKKKTKVFRLLDLPAEIRTMIYGHVFEETGEIRIRTYKPRKQPRRPVRDSFNTYCRRPSMKGLTFDRVHGKWLGQKPSALTMLSVSKRVFEEAAPIIYGDNTFAFDSTKEALLFFDCIGQMRKHLRTIRFHDIGAPTTTANTFRMLKDAKQLRTIEVCHGILCGSYYDWDRAHRPAPPDARTLVNMLAPLAKGLYKASPSGETSHSVLDIIRVYSEHNGSRCYGCKIGRNCNRANDTYCKTHCNDIAAHLKEIAAECKTRLALQLRIAV